MAITINIESQREKERAIKKARQSLRDCQTDRDSFLSRYPDHIEARKLYEKQVKVLNGNLDRLIRGT